MMYLGGKVCKASEARLAITSSAVLYGLSIYTVLPLRISKGSAYGFRIKEHYQRLKNSAQIIGIDAFGMNFEQFRRALIELAQANHVHQDVFVRISIHVTEDVAGTRSRGLKTDVSMFMYEALAILPSKGARIKTSIWRRTPDSSIPSRAKVNGAYVNSVLAKQDALDSGFDDCVFLDHDGHVCELSAANIFMIRGNELVTPSVSSDILEGINRQTVLIYARTLGLTVVERSIDLTELYIADEVFACGTSAYIAPIIEIDRRSIGSGAEGSVTKQLRDLHEQVSRNLIKEHAHLVEKIL